MNELKVFESPEFGAVRIIDTDGTPWMVGKDVAHALGYRNPQRAIRDHVDEDDKGVTEIVTPGGKQTVAIINESGLYALVLSSKLSTAKKFKHWVTSEVLPSIRDHGAYMTPEKLREAILNPDTMIQLCNALKDEQQKNKRLKKKIESDKPLVEFAQTVITSDGSIPISEFSKVMCCKGINIGYQRMLKWLKDNKFFMRSNIPYQRWVNQGIFEVSDVVYEKVTLPKAFITPKGQKYLYEKLSENYGK